MGSCLSSEGKQEGPCSPSAPGGHGMRKKRRSKKKSQGSFKSYSLESKRSGQLHKIPGRLFCNGASHCASLFTQQGRKGTNQDAMIFWENFGSRAGTTFCGVFDGHGPYGHMVAKKVRDCLPIKLNTHWDLSIENDNMKDGFINSFGGMNFEDSILCMEETEAWMTLEGQEKKHLDIFITLKDVFLRAFRVMDGELRRNPNIDSFSSGTTAVILVKQGQDVVIGNVGDSRAILGSKDENDNLVAVQLTVDLKPDLPSEQERIKQCKGRVFALQDEPEVARVWLPNNDSPGLAMARAFGDFCLKDYGLISVPDISYRHLTQRDEFIVLATDGVWDVLSNDEVVDVVASAPTQSSAARFLVESAVRAWKYKYPSSHVDDCAVVCLFLNGDTSSSRASYSDIKDRTTELSDPDITSMDRRPISLKRSGTVTTNDYPHNATEEYTDKDLGDQRHISSSYFNVEAR